MDTERGIKMFLNRYFKGNFFPLKNLLVKCNTENEICQNLLNSLNYPITNGPLLTFVNFDKQGSQNFTFTFNDDLKSTNALRDYFFALKNNEYLMDAISEKIVQDPKMKFSQKLNFLSLDEMFNKEQDLLLFFYNSENCGENCEEVILNMEKALEFLSENGIIHVYAGYFDMSKNSIFGLDLKIEESVMRYYKKNDMEEYSEVRMGSVNSLEKVLSFVIDMSSVHINVDFDGEEDL